MALTYDQFYRAFFELADLWCPHIDGEEYAHFLETLMNRLLVKVVHRANGDVLRYLPYIQGLGEVTLGGMPDVLLLEEVGLFPWCINVLRHVVI